MATLEKAVELAARAHAGQKDKSGMCYLLHPIRVMLRDLKRRARYQLSYKFLTGQIDEQQYRQYMKGQD